MKVHQVVGVILCIAGGILVGASLVNNHEHGIAFLVGFAFIGAGYFGTMLTR